MNLIELLREIDQLDGPISILSYVGDDFLEGEHLVLHLRGLDRPVSVSELNQNFALQSMVAGYLLDNLAEQGIMYSFSFQNIEVQAAYPFNISVFDAEYSWRNMLELVAHAWIQAKKEMRIRKYE